MDRLVQLFRQFNETPLIAGNVFLRYPVVKTSRGVGASLLAVIAGVTLFVSGCAGGSDAQLAQARQAGADAQAQKDAIKHQQDTQASLAAEVQRLKDEAAKAAAAKAAAADNATAAGKSTTGKTTAAAPVPAAVQGTSCGANLSVGPNTTCAFASNVESGYYQAGGGNARFDVYSPVTSRYYTMNCTTGVPIVCRGGNNAVVFIR